MFKNQLNTETTEEDGWYRLKDDLVFESRIVGEIIVPQGFITDFSSVPRVPIVYAAWGDRAHREAVIHDYLYRIDCVPNVTFNIANKVFLEAMISREVPRWIRIPMYSAVCLCGYSSFHKKRVFDKI